MPITKEGFPGKTNQEICFLRKTMSPNPPIGSGDRVQTRLIFTIFIMWWPWKLGQGHQNLITSFLPPNNVSVQVWSKSMCRQWAMGTPTRSPPKAICTPSSWVEGTKWPTAMFVLAWRQFLRPADVKNSFDDMRKPKPYCSKCWVTKIKKKQKNCWKHLNRRNTAYKFWKFYVFPLLLQYHLKTLFLIGISWIICVCV